MASWFRSWHGAPTDNKWVLIAKRAGVTPGMVSSVFWALLDYASQEEERGSVRGFDVESYAAWAGYEESQVHDILIAMEGKGIIEDGRLAAWEERQPAREDDSAERTRQWRLRKLNGNGSNGNSSDVTHGDAERRTETHQSRVDKSRVEAAAVATAAEPAAAAAIQIDPEYARWVKHYQYKAGSLVPSPYHSDLIKEWMGEITYEGWEYVMKEAAVKGQAKNWSYIESIVKRIARDGLPMEAQVKAAAAPREIKGNLGALLQ